MLLHPISLLIESLVNSFPFQQMDSFISGALFASFLWFVSISIFWGCLVSPTLTSHSFLKSNIHRGYHLSTNDNKHSNENNPLETKEEEATKQKSKVDDHELCDEDEEGDHHGDNYENKRNGVLEHHRKKHSSFRLSIVQAIQIEKERIRQSLTSQIRERWPWESLGNAASKSVISISSKNEGENDYLIPTAFDGMKESNNNDDDDSKDHDTNLLNHGSVRSEAIKSGTCIGSIFGLDCGGTLSKLLYFEHKPKNIICANESELITENQSKKNTKTTSSCASCSNKCDWKEEGFEVEIKMNRSYSMFEIASNKEEHQQALDRFYNFVRQLDTYGPQLKDKASSFYSRTLGGEFHFIQFQTQYITRAMDLIKVNNLHHNINQLGATGGGAHKYAKRWDEELQITISKKDELDSLVAGMQFMIADVVGECYTFKPNEEERMKDEIQNQTKNNTNIDDDDRGKATHDVHNNNDNTQSKEDESKKQSSSLDPYWWSKKVTRDYVAKTNSYPYLLVMIGTGVSVLRVDGPRKHERISGSTIGGGTYWGLCRLLTDAEDFESVLALAEQGDPSKVDMMVGDIYGEHSDALKKLGLAADVVASSFGKLVAKQHPARGLTQGDLARALLLMVTINIGQVALLNAKLHKTSRIFFVGNFLRQNVLSMKRLAFAIHYWSGGTMEALFLEHEGYFGALGAFLLENGIPQPKSSQSTIAKVNSETLLRRSRSDTC